MRSLMRAAVGAALTLALTAGVSTASAAPAPDHTQTIAAQPEVPRLTGLDTAKAINTSGTTVAVGSPTKRLGGPQMANTLPTSWNNGKYTVTVGYQGKIGSCVSWAVGYAGYGSLMKKQSIPGVPTAPMYIHSQVSGEKDRGTTVPTALNLAMRQGVAEAKVYTQGAWGNYWQLPTAAQRANAGQYKLSGYYRISPWDWNVKTRIKEAVYKGMPVIISLNVLENIKGLDAETARNYTYYPEGPIYGGHAMEITAYTEKGVRIQNSWGTSWGDSGRIWMSWDALLNSGTLLDIEAMGDIVYTPAPAPVL